MAFIRKNNKKKKEEIVITEEVKVEDKSILNPEESKELKEDEIIDVVANDVIIEPENETNEKPEIKEEKIEGEVIVSGRLFGASDLTAPLGSVRNYKTKILNENEIAIETEMGWISKDSIKD